MKTSYTKEELLGAIFKWDYEYVVIENISNNDVQLKNISTSKLHSNYDAKFLNENCLPYLVLDSLKNKIPDKWCIKCTPETYNDISKWFENELKREVVDFDKNSYWHYPQDLDGCCTGSTAESNYKEITFEFFKTVILKENIEEDDMSYLVNILKKYDIK